MGNYGDRFLGQASSQMTGVLIGAVSILALVIVAIVFLGMRKSVEGYQSPSETAVPPEGSPITPEVPAVSVRKMPVGTPGFVLPPPTEAPPLSAYKSVSPALIAPEPAAVRLESPRAEAALTSERTVELHREQPGPSGAGTKSPSSAQPKILLRGILIIRGGAREGETIRLDSFPGGLCAIGRSEVPENQLVVRDDLKVSRVMHAILTCDSSGQYSIRDNNSANRVFVNDQCIESAPVPLNSGDRFRLGLTEFEFVREPVS